MDELDPHHAVGLSMQCYTAAAVSGLITRRLSMAGCVQSSRNIFFPVSFLKQRLLLYAVLSGGKTFDVLHGCEISCMIVTDLSLRCFGGGSSDIVAGLVPSGSVERGFGNYGQIGSGDNETLGDEVSVW